MDNRTMLAYGLMAAVALAVAVFVAWKWFTTQRRTDRRRQKREDRDYANEKARRETGRESSPDQG